MKRLLIALMLIAVLAAIANPLYAEAEKEATAEEPQKQDEASETYSPTALPAAPTKEIKSGSIGEGISLSPLLSESFQTDLATGAATVSIPIVVPPGRKSMQPNLALSYSSNNSNGICGVGWGLTTSSIQRSTKKGIPKYNDTDTFVFASSGSSGELIPINDEKTEFRQKIETAFMKYVYNPGPDTWTVYDKSGTKYFLTHKLDNSLHGTFAWYLTRVQDIHGNYISYIYDQAEDGQVYLKEILYTGFDGTSKLEPGKKISFSYETRTDSQYSYRTGWKIITAQRLANIQVFLNEKLVWRYELTYKNSEDTTRPLLSKLTVYDSEGNSLPPKEFKYQTLE